VFPGNGKSKTLPVQKVYFIHFTTLVQTKGVFHKIDVLITGFSIPAFRTKFRKLIHQISGDSVSQPLVFQWQSGKGLGTRLVDADDDDYFYYCKK